MMEDKKKQLNLVFLPETQKTTQNPEAFPVKTEQAKIFFFIMKELKGLYKCFQNEFQHVVYFFFDWALGRSD